MAYINVNKPKFFINELQYQDSINNLKFGFYFTGEMYTEGPRYNIKPIYNRPDKKWIGTEIMKNH